MHCVHFRKLEGWRHTDRYIGEAVRTVGFCAGLTLDEMHGNVLLFFLAGHDTVSSAMSTTLFCLAANPECLSKAQQEVDKKLGQVIITTTTTTQIIIKTMWGLYSA